MPKQQIGEMVENHTGSRWSQLRLGLPPSLHSDATGRHVRLWTALLR